jgi:hypothetical protein
VGIVARSYWISHAQALAADPDEGIPLAKARIIGPDSVDDEVELAPALADEQGLASLRVLWVRNTGDSASMAQAMGLTEASIRRLIPQHGLDPMFTELLVPRTLRDLEIPVPPPDWQQFVVEPMDRPSPAASDSFWDQDAPARQGLHAALMIGGILGGSNLELPAPRDAKTDSPWVVHPFTRAVRGADRARQETRAVLRDRLSTISAADVAPDLFFAPEPPEDSEYVDDASAWILGLDNEALRFHRPQVSFVRRGQPFLGFLWEVLRFLGWALRGMFGLRRWRDMILAVRARIARRLEADDYGSTIDAAAPTPQGLDLTDFDALEGSAQQAAVAQIAAAARSDGRVPDRVVWVGLAHLVPSLIDGSGVPNGWTPRTRFDHAFVLAPQSVIRTEPVVLASAAKASSGDNEAKAAGGAPAYDELRGVKRIGERELARALQLARAGLGEDLVRYESPTGRVTLTAQTIADQAQAEGTRHRDELARSLDGGAVSPRGELPLLGRIRASVVSDLLLARFCAEQLASMTRTAVPSTLENLRKLLRDGTWVVLGAVLIDVGIIAFLARFAREIDALFAVTQVPYPTSWTQLAVWVIAALIAVLLFLFTRLFYVYHAYNEAGRRRLEYVERRGAAAVLAYEERNRLRNAERILSAWEDILSDFGRRDDDSEPPLADVPSDLPDALQVAEPDIDADDLERLIIQDAISPGWFGQGLSGLIDHVLTRDDQERVWADPGMPGGPLARLREAAVDGTFQRDWWDAWADRTADKVVTRLAADTTQVRPLAARRSGTMTAQEFHTEITRAMTPEYRPGADYRELFDAYEDGRRSMARARQGTAGFLMTPALTAIDTVLVFRRLGRVPGGSHSAPGEASDGAGGYVDPGVGRV